MGEANHAVDHMGTYIKLGRSQSATVNSAGIYSFKFSNGITGTMWEICSKLAIKTPERCLSDVFNSKQVSRIVLGFPLLTLDK